MRSEEVFYQKIIGVWTPTKGGLLKTFCYIIVVEVFALDLCLLFKRDWCFMYAGLEKQKNLVGRTVFVRRLRFWFCFFCYLEFYLFNNLEW